MAEQPKDSQDRVAAGLEAGPHRRTGLRKGSESEPRIREASPVVVAQVQHSSQKKVKPSSRIPTVVHNKTAGQGYEKGSPLYKKQESMDKDEIVFDSSTGPTKNKIVLSLINAFGLGFLGIDRCFMGHIGQGVIKGLTGGGLIVWFLLDYVLILFNCLFQYKSIQVLGYRATFSESHILPAFWITIVMIVLKLAAGAYKGKDVYDRKRGAKQ